MRGKESMTATIHQRTRGLRGRASEGTSEERSSPRISSDPAPAAPVASATTATSTTRQISTPSRSASTRHPHGHLNRVQAWQEVGRRETTRHSSGMRGQMQEEDHQQQRTRHQQRRVSSAGKPPPSSHIDRQSNPGSTKRTTGSGRSISTPRRHPQSQTARVGAPRREYTLFDHLFSNNTSVTPHRSQPPSDIDRHPGENATARAPQQRIRKEGIPLQTEPPERQDKYSSQPPVAEMTSAGVMQGTSCPPHQPLRGSSARGAGSATFLQPARGGGASAGGGGVLKNAAPSPHVSAGPNSCYVPKRAVLKRDDMPKPGKQRLGPRKKKLSSLKKKILLDRLEKWKDIKGESSPPPTPATRKKKEEEEVCPSISRVPNGASSSQSSPLFTPGGGGGDGIDEFSRVGNDDTGQEKSWVVTIHNLVDDQDVQDSDDHAEVERDLWEMASSYGVVRRIDVPRSAMRFSNHERVAGLPAEAVPAKVVFATPDEAQRAQKGFNGRIVGGKALQVEIDNGVTSVACTGSHPPAHAPTDAPANHTAGRSLWRVAVRNLIDEEDDLDDEDDYAEVWADISAMMGVHGNVIALDIPRRPGRSDEGVGKVESDGVTTAIETAGQVVVVTFGSLKEAQGCVEGIKGRLLGGKELDAALLMEGISTAGQLLEGEPERQKAAGATKTDASNVVREEPTITTAVELSSPPSQDNHSTSAAAGNITNWHVVIRNLIDEDDLCDDDDYDEICTDVTSLASAYGSITGLYIPRHQTESGLAMEEIEDHEKAGLGEAVVVYGSRKEAGACAQGLSGRKIGGKILNAQVLTKRSQREAETPGVEADRGTRTAKGGQPQSGEPFDSVPEPFDTRLGLISRGETNEAGDQGAKGPEFLSNLAQDSPRAAAVAKHRSDGLKTTVFTEPRSRIQPKYKEAAALPKPPGVSVGGSPNTYVNQRPDEEIDDLVFEMLQLLFKFQERARLSDPVKAKTRRRIVMGLREVLRGVKARKVRLLIVAPNVDSVGGEGGLDDKVMEILDTAREGETPVVFALSKRKIGKALGKSIKVSAVGVYSFDGAHEQQKQAPKGGLDSVKKLVGMFVST